MVDLPNELAVRPTALVGLVGLDESNPVHRAIWDAFNNNRRPDSAAIHFKLFGSNHKYPTVKPKRNTYEWYVPKGILKRNWMNKYLNEIPAVVVLFYDLDWHNPTWNDKKMECVSRVQSLRAALEGRNTKIIVVLIQKESSQTSNSEDSIATERATALCSACELPAKALYQLPYADHLVGYTFRLEHTFYDFAQTFYHQEYKIVKSHREQLNKSVHQFLFARHQFKMAFFNELKQDQNQAYKYYQQAYNNLLDIKMVDTNCLEIKTIASFINYKLCRLKFSLKLPKDAISQFRSHIERFKTRTGPKELLFEHLAWMSSQYSTFAELFVEAIRQGLPAVQTQHPGYYFQIAATYASQRHNVCKELCRDIAHYPDPNPLNGEDKLEFYGQRPWRPGKLNPELLDVSLESSAIQALQYKEISSVNHSLMIIGLLGNAVSQFKIYRCPRMRRQLVIQMAEEYFSCKDYGKVLTLLMHMLWEYRAERWPILLTDILKNALNAAYLSASVQDYLTLALESLGPSSTFSINHKDAIFTNIKNILQKKPPNPELNLPEELNSPSIIDKWIYQLNKIEPFTFTIDDDNMITFLDVKARFTSQVFTVESIISVEIYVKNQYHDSVECEKINIIITSPGYSSEFLVTDTKEILKFSAKETRKFIYNFEAEKYHQTSEIQISHVLIYLGSDTLNCIIRFSAIGRDSNVMDRVYPEIQQFRANLFDSIRPMVLAQIQQGESKLIINAEPNGPALLGEWFPVSISLSSSENISNIIISMNLIIENNNEQLTDFSLNAHEKQSVVMIEVKELEANACAHRKIYIRAHNVGDRNFNIKIEYLRHNKRKDFKEKTYSLPIVKPFDVSTMFYTILHEPLTKAFINEPLFLMPHIKCISPWPIQIENTSIELGNSVITDEAVQKNILKDVILANGETGTDVFCIIPKVTSELASTGIYTIKWKRANQDNAIVNSSSVTLTPLWIEDAVIGIKTIMPPHGWVRTPLCISYFIRNYSDYLITLKMNMEASDAFMFAGHKQIDISILPECEKKVEWILRPLVAGFVALPSLSFLISPDEEYKLNKTKLSEVVERSVPSHIYILPKY